MPQQKQNKNQSKGGRAWKMERASVNKQGASRPKSNKYSTNDTSKKPAPGSRQRVWVGGYTRQDGSKVEGYFREINSANNNALGSK